jgi:integrase
LAFNNMTPDDLIREYDSSPKGTAERRLSRFLAEAQMSERTKGHIARVVQSFYRANFRPLSLVVSEPMPARERDYIPSKEEIQRMVQSCANPRDKALIMMLAETGMRIGTLVELRWKHVKDEFFNPRPPHLVHVPVRPTKRKRGGYVTFIADDAIHFLRRALLGRQLSDEDPIFGIGEARAMEIVKEAGKRIGIAEDRLFEFRSHCFRKRVQTIYVQAGLEGDVVDILMGHQPRGTAQADAYIRFPVEFLRQAYAKAMPLLRVF